MSSDIDFMAPNCRGILESVDHTMSNPRDASKSYKAVP